MASSGTHPSHKTTHTIADASTYTYIIRPVRHSDLPYLPAVESSAAHLFTSIPALSHLAEDEPMNVEAHQEILGKWTGWKGDLGIDLGGQEAGEGTWVVVAMRGRDEGGNLEEDRQSCEDRQGEGEEEIVGFVVTELLPVVREMEHETGSGTSVGSTEGYFLHIDELSISAAHQRKGLARRLLGTVKEFAARLGSPLSRAGDGNDDSTGTGLRILGLSLTTFRDVPFNAPFYAKFGFEEVERDGVERMVGVEGERVWKEDRRRFERVSGSAVGMKRCWMVCRL